MRKEIKRKGGRGREGKEKRKGIIKLSEKGDSN